MLQAGNKAIFSADKCVSLLVWSQSDVRGSRLTTYDDVLKRSCFAEPLSPGASATSLSPMTPAMTINYANTKMTDRKEPITDTTAGADIIRAPERVTSTNASEGIILFITSHRKKSFFDVQA